MMLEYTVEESGRTRRGRCCCAEGRCTWMLPPPRVPDWLYPSSGITIENVSAVPGSPWSMTVTLKVTGVELAVAVPSILLVEPGTKFVIPVLCNGQVKAWAV